MGNGVATANAGSVVLGRMSGSPVASHRRSVRRVAEDNRQTAGQRTCEPRHRWRPRPGRRASRPRLLQRSGFRTADTRSRRAAPRPRRALQARRAVAATLPPAPPPSAQAVSRPHSHGTRAAPASPPAPNAASVTTIRRASKLTISCPRFRRGERGPGPRAHRAVRGHDRRRHPRSTRAAARAWRRRFRARRQHVRGLLGFEVHARQRRRVKEGPALLDAGQHAFPVQPVQRRHQRRVGDL